MVYMSGRSFAAAESNAAVSMIMFGRETRAMLFQLTDQIVANGGKALQITEFSRSDESKFKTRVDGNEVSASSLAASSSLEITLPLAADADEACETEIASYRILQHLRNYSALYRLGGPVANYLNVTFEVPCPLVPMADKFASTNAHSLLASEIPMGDVSALSDRSQIFGVTDGDGALGQGFRATALHKAQKWIHVTCGIHAVANFFELVFGVMAVNVIGLLNFALSLQSGDHMRKFRRCAQDVVERRRRQRHCGRQDERKEDTQRWVGAA